MPAHLARLLPFLLLCAFAAPALAEEEEPPICDQGTSSITKAACDARLQKYQPILAEGAPMVDIKARCPKISGLSYDMRCVDPPIPPSPGILVCESTGGGFMCEAMPQGDGLTYGWTVSGSVTLSTPGTPESPFRNVSCTRGGGGTVTVTVTSPFALSATYSRNVYCSY